MPVYQLIHSGIPLSPENRRDLAQGITAIHHDETNAPEPFIRVVFTPLPLGSIYMAGEVAPSVLLNCGIRAGRSHATRQRIITRCYDLLSKVTQAPPDQLFVVVTEGPSEWIMEAGYFLPEPTDEAEAAWIKQLQDTFPGKYDGWGTGQHPGGNNERHARAAHRRELAKEEVKQYQRVTGVGGKTSSTPAGDA